MHDLPLLLRLFCRVLAHRGPLQRHASRPDKPDETTDLTAKSGPVTHEANAPKSLNHAVGHARLPLQINCGPPHPLLDSRKTINLLVFQKAQWSLPLDRTNNGVRVPVFQYEYLS